MIRSDRTYPAKDAPKQTVPGTTLQLQSLYRHQLTCSASPHLPHASDRRKPTAVSPSWNARSMPSLRLSTPRSLARQTFDTTVESPSMMVTLPARPCPRALSAWEQSVTTGRTLLQVGIQTYLQGMGLHRISNKLQELSAEGSTTTTIR